MIHQVPHYVISMRYCISKDMSCLRKGDTNAELQAAPNLQRHLLPGIVNGSASEKSILFSRTIKVSLPLVLIVP